MSAVSKLEGLELANGWRVVRLLVRSSAASGGVFSHSYLVERTAAGPSKPTLQQGFLKAFDFAWAFEAGEDTIKRLQLLTNAFDHEREVLEHIKKRSLSHAVTAIDHGSVQVAGFGQPEGLVYYLIFDLAAGDVRVQMDQATAQDALWCMIALRDVTLGLWQVHREYIAHQDTKPSNVLIYPGPHFRIADFGRSSMRGRAAPHDELKVAGDMTYAPPELLYGQVDSDFVKRRIACDLYMLGNLAAFLFSGVNVSTEIMRRLAQDHHPRRWQGTYIEVLPYIRTAFREFLTDLEPMLDTHLRTTIISIVSELCEPDVSRRGHPRGIGGYNQFSLQRYVSQLDRATKELEISLRVVRKTA